MEDNKKQVGIYCRVSTTEQAEEGYSIGEQERLLTEYAINQGYEVYKVYTDAGISGKDIKHRPGLIELLEDASNKKFQMVISWKINRLSRKLSDAIKIVDTLEKHGIAYKSYTEPFETDTPAGKMQFQLMALIGEFERNTIAQNVKMGMKAKARAGEWCGGLAPLGYKWIPMEKNVNSSRKKSKLAIEESEAEIVRLIFNMYASGKGYKAICNYLNHNGYKTKRDNSFATQQIRSILLNPVYLGKVRWNVNQDWNEKRRKNANPNPVISDGIHEAIIDEALWNRVQALIKEKGGKIAKKYECNLPLTGILRCPECGSGMVLSRTTNVLKDGTRRQLNYYACGNWKNKGTAVCHANSIRVEKANQVVYQELEKLFANEKLIGLMVEKVNQETIKQQEYASKRVEAKEKSLLKLKKEKEKLYDSYMEGIFDGNEYIEHKNRIAKEIEVAELAISEIKVEDNNSRDVIPYQLIKDILTNFRVVMESPMIEQKLKNCLMHMLIEKITLDKRREVESIVIQFNNEIVDFLNSTEGTSHVDVPSFILIKSKMTNEILAFQYKIAI